MLTFLREEYPEVHSLLVRLLTREGAMEGTPTAPFLANLYLTKVDRFFEKTKAKIRRKSDALRRWRRRKGLSADKAAVGLIHVMNQKFYGCDDPLDEENRADAFTWSRWFFPLLTTDRGLREIDAYMQEYIRYTVTGRHYKGNYRISCGQLQRWGYVSLVHEYYRHKEGAV